ncbi:MAG: hypothetical protein EAZ09_13835 [Oscillatoriales cyanobacterium]|nr:MAG: hypothetical protein EAZ18_11925 [Oscillatoriales cyanobacterium]TAH20665.1 MAG: hypothetical protein EAZ09_13835 [Oscillatoriales cyanobacterium]
MISEKVNQFRESLKFIFYQCFILSQLKVQSIVRQGLKPLPQSESPLKRTEEKNFQLISPLERTFAIRQGIHSLADWRAPVADKNQKND